MQVGLKVWRFNSRSGERELQEYEISAPEEATLLDCLDIVKDQHDGTLAYRKSCRMMICGSCGMRMDGAAVLACKTRMYDIAQAGHVPVISAMGNLPIVKDLVVDMEPFWEKFRSVDPYLQPGYEEPPDGKEYRIDQARMNVIHKEALCINCGCCVSECNSMEADPRDAIAKLGAESMHEGIDRDMGAKHARWFVVSAKTTGWLRETELVPKTQGVIAAIKQTRFALDLARKGKVPPPFPPHVAKDVKESRRLYDLTTQQGPKGFMGIVQGEHALGRLEHGHTGTETLAEIYARPGAFTRPFIAGEELEAPVFLEKKPER